MAQALVRGVQMRASLEDFACNAYRRLHRIVARLAMPSPRIRRRATGMYNVTASSGPFSSPNPVA